MAKLKRGIVYVHVSNFRDLVVRVFVFSEVIKVPLALSGMLYVLSSAESWPVCVCNIVSN
jgi:hypothetical protein